MKLFDADILSYVVYDAHIAHEVAWELFETALHQEIALYVLPTTILETYNTLFWYYRVRPRRALLEKLGAIIDQMSRLPVAENGILVAQEKNIPLVMVSLILLGVAITLVINALKSLRKVAEA